MCCCRRVLFFDRRLLLGHELLVLCRYCRTFVALCTIYFPSVTGALCPIHTALRDETVLLRWIGQCEWDIGCCWCGNADRIKNCHITTLQPFNGLFSRTTWVSRYQNGKTNLDFTGARDSEWQWHQLGHMQVYNSLQTDNHASTPPLCFYRPDALPAAQPTASKH